MLKNKCKKRYFFLNGTACPPPRIKGTSIKKKKKIAASPRIRIYGIVYHNHTPSTFYIFDRVFELLT